MAPPFQEQGPKGDPMVRQRLSQDPSILLKAGAVAVILNIVYAVLGVYLLRREAAVIGNVNGCREGLGIFVPQLIQSAYTDGLGDTPGQIGVTV
jgi:hypothetical protein